LRLDGKEFNNLLGVASQLPCTENRSSLLQPCASVKL